MESTQTADQKETLQDRTADYIEKKGRLHLIPATAAAERLEWEAERQMRMIEAEDRKVAKELGWEIPEGEQAGQGDSMKQTVLGDLTINQTQPEKDKSSFSKLLATGLLGAGLGVGGVLLGNMLSDSPDTDTDTSVEMGLGKIEDYLKPGE